MLNRLPSKPAASRRYKPSQLAKTSLPNIAEDIEEALNKNDTTRCENDTAYPGVTGGLEQAQRTDDVNFLFVEGLLDRIPYRRDGRMVQDDLGILHSEPRGGWIAQVPDHEIHIGVAQVVSPTARQVVEGADFMPIRSKAPTKVRADETGAAGDENTCHLSISLSPRGPANDLCQFELYSMVSCRRGQ